MKLGSIGLNSPSSMFLIVRIAYEAGSGALEKLRVEERGSCNVFRYLKKEKKEKKTTLPDGTIQDGNVG